MTEKEQEKVNLILKEAQELGDELDLWIKRMGNENGIKNNFIPWVKKNYPDDCGSLTYSTQKTCRKYLWEIKNTSPRVIVRESFSFYDSPAYKNAKRFIRYAEEYDKKNKVKLNTPSTNVKYWYLYFLAIGKMEKKYPKLGRGVLIMQKNGDTELKIPDENPINDYFGKYSPLNSHIGFFDLDTTEYDENRNKRVIKKLHVKIYFRTLDDEIIIGSYSTYDKRIYTGALILERIRDKALYSDSKELNKKVKFLSYIENREEFVYDIDNTIKSYLTSKSKNIRQLPTTIVQDVYGLEALLDSQEKKPSRVDDIENRFLEPERPIIFITSPQKSLKKNGSALAIKNFINSLPKEIYSGFNTKISVLTEESFSSEPARTRPLKILRCLEKSRYFILLLPETDKISYPILQLGWAIKSSKNVLLICQEGTVSDRLKELTFVNSNFIMEDMNFNSEKGRSDILNIIFMFLVSHKLD